MPSYWSDREDYGRKAFPPSMPHKLESMRGPGNSNVVLKNFCLSGPHPGNTAGEVVSSLTPILRAGVTTFVSLQQEMPKPGNSNPSQRSTFGSGVVVTARDYLRDAQNIVDAGGFPQTGGPKLSLLHLAVPDTAGGVAADEQVKALALDLMAHMRAGEFLYLQCGDGNGRSGTMAALLMGLAHGISSSEALDLCQRSRGDRPGAGGRAPETHEQKMQVHRLLGDATLRAAAARAGPRKSNSLAADEGSRLAATLAKIRAVLARRGATSLVYLRRYVQANVLGAGAPPLLSRAHFDRVCADAEWFLTPTEADTLWAHTRSKCARGADTLWAAIGGSGAGGEVPAEALWAAVRGPLPPRRAAAVHEVFRRLSSGTGFVGLRALCATFSPVGHPDVTSGRRTVEAVSAEFNDTFGVASRTAGTGGGGAAVGDGSGLLRPVSAAEFEAYYAALSPCVADDALFELIVFGSWQPVGAPPFIPSSPFSPGSSGAGGGGLGADSGPRAMVPGGDDGRGVVSRLAILRRDVPVTGKIAAAGDKRGSGGDAAEAAVALSEAFVLEMREQAAATAQTAPRRAQQYQSGAASAAAATAAAAALASTEGGYSYVDLEGLPRASLALRSYLRRTPAAGPFSLAALGGALRRLDSRRTGMASAADLQAALQAVGAALPAADVELIFRAVDASLQGVEPAQLTRPSAALPLEDLHAALRTPLEGSRRRAVLDIFNAFDASGRGAVPAGTLLAAFNGDAFPAVAAGRVPAQSVYRAFQDGFADAFAAVDGAGPAARAAARAGGSSPSAAASAYYGHGDGCVRFPFFEAFHEALSALVVDDAEFVLAVNHVWSGGGFRGRRTVGGGGTGVGSGGAGVGSGGGGQRLADRAGGREAGLVASITQTANHPYTHAHTAGHGGLGVAPGTPVRSFSYRGDTELGTAPARPPAHASAVATSTAALQQQQQAAAVPAELARFGLSGAGAGPLIYSGGDGFSGRSGTSLRGAPASGHYTVGHGARVERECTPHVPPPTGDADADTAVATIRSVLLARGCRGLFSLAAALQEAADEDMTARQSRGLPAAGAEEDSVPGPAFAAVLRDASLGLASRELEAVARVCACQQSTSGGGPDFGSPLLLPQQHQRGDSRRGSVAVGAGVSVSVPALLQRLRGDLGAAREDVVRTAYAHVARATGHAPASGYGPLHPAHEAAARVPLEELQLRFRSAAHPDVVAGRRSEEEVLREFLETLAGWPYVCTLADGTPAVSCRGMLAYYRNASFYASQDASFVKTIYDCWGLSGAAALASSSDAAGAVPAGRPTTAGPTAPSFSSPRGGGGGTPAPAASPYSGGDGSSPYAHSGGRHRGGAPPAAAAPRQFHPSYGNDIFRAGRDGAAAAPGMEEDGLRAGLRRSQAERGPPLPPPPAPAAWAPAHRGYGIEREGYGHRA